MSAPEGFDVVVLGSGAAGLTAALVAATEGLSVCLVEKDAKLGGTTAWSGGMVWAPLSGAARAVGHTEDTADAVWSYLAAILPDISDAARLKAFVTAAPEAVDYLNERTVVQLRPVPVYPDYYPDAPGATKAGRVLEPQPFDASCLRGTLALLRRPLPEFALFGDMMVARTDIPKFRSVFRSARSFATVTGLLLRHLREKLRHGRGTSLVLGNALVGRLVYACQAAGVTFKVATRVRDLTCNAAGTVDGVVLADGSRLEGRQGVVLATGGFSQDPKRRQSLLPPALADNSATAHGATGDGADLAERVGGLFLNAEEGNAFWAPVSRYRRANGSEAVYPHTVTDRSKPGLIAVDGEGKRFTNEAVSYHEFVKAMLANGNAATPDDGGAWLLCDSRFLWLYGLGAVKPMTRRLRSFLSQGYLHRGETLGDLEACLSLPKGALVETVAHYNRGADAGGDPDFGRGGNVYQRFLGDASIQPNPCVAPLRKPPFYAVKVLPGDLGAAAGLDTDEVGRVRDRNGRMIAGLYACGADMRSVMQGAYPAPGITLGPAITFGYLIAMDMFGRSRCNQ
ncbi:FAD-dependent oxidoreductase [Algihabitans albus]|uniref:FAD-dependent oxidoreductase n=1 Tax=Algihabitans albus TaxID=2164067 RepID=UPI000E5CE565|nr:FAD-dependent oxidoreductase [Algihabitans albus]